MRMKAGWLERRSGRPAGFGCIGCMTSMSCWGYRYQQGLPVDPRPSRSETLRSVVCRWEIWLVDRDRQVVRSLLKLPNAVPEDDWPQIYWKSLGRLIRGMAKPLHQ